jgi:ATP-dependent Lon protease
MNKKSGATLLLLLIVSAFSISFQLQTQKKKSSPEESYSSYWRKVDSLAKKGLNKSALETVMKIYEKSKAEKNDVQLVMAVIHRMKFSSFTEEDEVQKSIIGLKKEIAESEFPTNAILHSILAETYSGYYEQNRWKFMNRTETVNFNNDDISTWDLKKIFEQIVLEYRQSLDQKDKLEKIQVNVFDEILEKGNTAEARSFRPTLYDFPGTPRTEFLYE